MILTDSFCVSGLSALSVQTTTLQPGRPESRATEIVGGQTTTVYRCIDACSLLACWTMIFYPFDFWLAILRHTLKKNKLSENIFENNNNFYLGICLKYYMVSKSYTLCNFCYVLDSLKTNGQYNNNYEKLLFFPKKYYFLLMLDIGTCKIKLV